MTLWIGSLQLGLLYGIMAIGIYISFRILNTPDLTAEGSFTFGLAVSAIVTVSGHPFLGIILAVLAGALAGAVTAFLQTKLFIHPVLAGILTMSGLYSINLWVMGGSSNLSLIGKDTIFKSLQNVFGMDANLAKTVLAVLAAGICVVLLILRLGSIMADDVTQVLVFYNTAVYDVGDVLGTYMYRQGLGKMEYSFSSAAGLFQSVIGMALILITNKFAHMMGEQGLW